MKYLLLTLMLASSAVFSAWEPGSDGSYKIIQMVTEGDDKGPRIYLKLSQAGEVGECKNVSGGSLIRLQPINTTAENYQVLYNQLYSAALSGYVSQSEVKLKMNGCDDWDRPKAIAIWLK